MASLKFVITPQDVSLFLTLIISAATVWGIALRVVKKAKAPEEENKAAITALQEDSKDEDKRLNELEAGTRVTQKALLALLGHAIDGNNMTALRDAEKELKNYLVNK